MALSLTVAEVRTPADIVRVIQAVREAEEKGIPDLFFRAYVHRKLRDMNFNGSEESDGA